MRRMSEQMNDQHTPLQPNLGVVPNTPANQPAAEPDNDQCACL
jgi:hypothetical protein